MSKRTSPSIATLCVLGPGLNHSTGTNETLLKPRWKRARLSGKVSEFPIFLADHAIPAMHLCRKNQMSLHQLLGPELQRLEPQSSGDPHRLLRRLSHVHPKNESTPPLRGGE